MINLKISVVNAFGVNSFVLYDETGECILIDAGYYTETEQENIVRFIDSNHLKPVMLLCTHCHIDHILGNNFIEKKYQIPVAAHKDESFLLQYSVEMGNMFGLKVDSIPVVTKFIGDGEKITFGNSVLNLFHVPGHSPGSLAFYSSSGKFVVSGDTLFAGSIGRTDLPGGDYNTLLKSIREKLLTLPGETTVYPGHGPSSSIKAEHDTNPFFK